MSKVSASTEKNAPKWTKPELVKMGQLIRVQAQAAGATQGNNHS